MVAELLAGRRGPFRVGVGEAAGAVADLGVMVPLAAALILVNGLDAGAVFVCAGALVIAVGVAFRIPFPVQPLKALTAVAVAQQLAPDVIHAAGLEIAAVLLLLSFRHVADVVARVFTTPVVRALQFGVGVLLVFASVKLVLDPPDVFASTPAAPWPWILMLAAFVGVVVAARTRHYWVALAVLGAGAIAATAAAVPHVGRPVVHTPRRAPPHRGRVRVGVLPPRGSATPAHVRQRGGGGERSRPRIPGAGRGSGIPVPRVPRSRDGQRVVGRARAACRCATEPEASPPTSGSAPAPPV